MSPTSEGDLFTFLNTAAGMVDKAIFVATSLPNAEPFAVEQAILCLEYTCS